MVNDNLPQSAQPVGTIISTEESPSTSEFSFVVDEKANGSVKKGQYVQVERPMQGKTETIFGYVSEMFRANRYFERAESVADYEKEMPLRENFPTDSWEYTIANVRILGTHCEDKFGRAHIPPSPGLKVRLANEEMLKGFLGFSDSGLLMGNLQHHDLEARLDLTRLFQKHVAILAMSGAGKSHLMSVLLEEMLEREMEKGRLAIIVIDIHGEYIGFGLDGKYGSNTKTIEGRDVFVPLRRITPEMVDEWLPLMSAPQREVLRYAMSELRADKKAKKTGESDKANGLDERSASSSATSFKGLLEKIENSPVATKEDTKKTLKRILGELKRYRFISKGRENPKLADDVKPGKMLVLDLSDTDSMRKKQILVSYISRRLFKLRKKGKIPPFVLVIEEAHNFAREKAEAHEAVSRGIIETIAREGRKFGASLCLISQRPVNLSTTALSQCNTHIILRVTNPNDLDHIQMSSEGIDSRIAKNITGLQVGEAIIVGAATNHPVFVSVRDRKSQKREKGKPLHEQAIEFEMKEEKKKGDVEAFL